MMPQTTPPPVGLCVQDLTVRYGTAAVLQGVSFSVPVPGQLIGLLGVNGSGKTTLLKAAAGLLPHTGQCLLDGVPLESLSTRRLAQTVSDLPQQSGISRLPRMRRCFCWTSRTVRLTLRTAAG